MKKEIVKVPEYAYYCDICDAHFSNERDINVHLFYSEHADSHGKDFEITHRMDLCNVCNTVIAKAMNVMKPNELFELIVKLAREHQKKQISYDYQIKVRHEVKERR